MANWPKPMSIVEVEWVDSTSTNGWQRFGTIETEPAKCKTAGYLYERGRHHLTIVQSMSDGNHVDEALTIPRACVRVITVLKKVSKR